MSHINEEIKIDYLIIGAGVVGCALASALSRKFKNKSILVAEAGPRIAEGVTSRNSGVIHAGIYYPPQSLKAKSCIRGKNLLYEWALKKNVSHKNIGKLIVAKNEIESEMLDKLLSNAIESGATGLLKISSNELKNKEPDLSGVINAVFSSQTGIIDPYELAKSFKEDAESRDVMFLTNTKVFEISLSNNGMQKVSTTRGKIECEIVFNSTGLYADEVSALAGINKYKIYPVKGNYFKLRTKQKYNHLIYPVKNPKDAGLGVHLTIDMAGEYRLGPDVEYIISKEDFSAQEEKKIKFINAVEKLFGTKDFELSYDTCGIRPKLRSPTDDKEKDFIVSKDHPGMINFVGIESPGLTSAMALADTAIKLI
ncbi:MAG: NAD(P)/FAD-dependent oxidoreductase [Oligoflexia bacterium]|nr:NAD(P)/FAD-dependent oxidoreductase [Oligoflexia bacterium]